jgi:VCBS repeat-containing protein
VAPTVEITTDADNSGIVSTAELNGASTFTVKGSFDKTKVVAGDKLVFTDGSSTPVVSTVVLTADDISNGFATTTFNKPPENGSLTVTVKVQDAAGNSSPTSTSDTASLDTTAPNGGVAPTVEITTDADNSGIVNATELNGASTFTVKGSFDKTKVAVGDKLVFTDGSSTPVVSTVVLTATDISNGFATTTFNKPPENGSLTVTVKVQDAAGNSSPTSTSDTASLDTTAPNGGVAPTVEITTDADNSGIVSTAELNGASTFTVKGSFDKTKVVAGDKLVFTDGSSTPVVSTVVLTATDISNGFATTTFNKPAENGSLTVTVKVQDAAGNSSPTSTSDTASLDTTVPNGGVAPTVEITTDTNNDGVVNSTELNSATTFTVKGSFDKTKVVVGDKLVFTDGSTTPVVSTVVLSATDISNGFATTTFNKPAENGSLTVTVKVQDAAGNSSPTSTSDTASLDTTAPNGGVAPTVEITTDADNSGIVSTAELNGATTFTVKGSFDKTNVAVGDKLVFTDSSTTPVVSTVVLTATDISNGFATTTFNKPAENGSLTVTVKVQDAVGNNSPTSATDTAKLDTTAPNGGAAVGLTIDLDVPASNDGIISSAEKGTATETSLTATFDKTLVAVGDKVTFSDGTTTKVVTLLQADITAGKVVSTGWALPNEGSTLNVTAVLTDAAGNATPQATDSAKLDTTAPNGNVAPTVTITTDADNNGLVGATELNGATTFTVRGDFDKTTVVAGDKLVFTAGSTVNTVVLTADDITAGFATTTFAKPNNGGALTVNVLVQDAAGNQSPVSADDTATLDTTAPTLTITHDKTVLLAGEISTVTFTFSEAVADFDLNDIDATGAEGSVTGLTQSTTDPKVWTATFTPLANVNDTSNVIKVANNTFTDVAGNNGTGDDSDNFEIKTEVPSVTITLADSALKAGETSLVTYTFSQTPTGFTKDDVSISGAKGTLSDPVVTPNTDNKVWTATFTPTVDIEDATNVITIAADSYTNSAGVNGTAGTSANFVIDTKAPTLSITMADSTLTVGETSKVTFTFSEAPTGFSAADVTVPTGIGAISGLAATSNPLVWEALFTPATNLASTNDIISVAASTYTDAAGNNGGAAQTSAFTIDTTVPTVTVEMGKSALKGGETTTVTFTFSQLTTDFALTDVDVSGAQGSLSNLVQVGGATSKIWTATFTPTAQIEDATNIIKVKADSYTNASGNKGTEGTSANFTIDTLPPSTTIVIDAIDDNQGTSKGTVASGGVTDDTTPTVNGTLSTALTTGQTVHIFDNGVDIGTATISVGSTAFTFNDTRSTIVDGSNLKYTAKVFDAAGNAGTASNLYTATITTTVPTITVTSVAGDAITGSNLNGTFDTTELAALKSTAKTLPVISGTTTNVDVGQTVTVTLNGNTYTTTVGGTKASGTWSINVPEADALLLNHGNTYDISASVADVVGQTATDTDNKLVVDVAALDVPTVVDVKTNIHTPTLTGLAQKLVSGSPVALETNDTLQIVIKNPDGTTNTTVNATIGSTLPTGFSYDASTKTWSFNTSTANLSLPDGTYNVEVTVTDPAQPSPNNVKTDVSSSELIIDSSAPVFSSGTTATVAENIDISVAANAVVYTAAASDSTTGNHGATFTLKAGVGDAAKFSIDSATGKVSIKESPNFEDANRTNHQYTFTVVATDTFGNKSEKAVTLTVTNVNEAPVAVADTVDATEAGGTANATAGTNPAANALTNDTDVDASDTKTVKDIKPSSATSATAVTASTTSSTGTEVTGSFGKLKIGADGSYVYTVDNTNATVQALNTSSTALSDVFTYTVQDAGGLTSTATITVSVKGANDAPVVANAIADTTGTEGTALSYVIAANSFSDVDDSTLTLSATLANGNALPTWLTFNASTRTFSGTPPTNTGTVSVKVTATDSGNLAVSDTFDIVVAAANTAPTANPTTVNNKFATVTGPEVVITDNKSTATVANNTEVTYTLTFSEAIVGTSLTESDLSVTNGTLKAGSLTKVNDTTWTVIATTNASTATVASGGMALNLANGSYTSTAGVAGAGGTGVQYFGTLPAPVPGTATQVSTVSTPYPQTNSESIQTLNDGGWVVVYSANTNTYAQRFDAAGNKVGSEITAGTGNSVTVTELADGGFALAWMTTTTVSTTTTRTVSVQRFDASSNLLGPVIKINNASNASIAGLDDGGFVLVASAATTPFANFANKYDANGSLIGTSTPIDSLAFGASNWVTKLSSGGYVVTWSRAPTSASSDFDVFSQLFDSTGAKVGDVTKVNATAISKEDDPSVSELEGGGYVVSWSSTNGAARSVRAQVFDAAGSKVGNEIIVAAAGTTNLNSPGSSSVEGLVGGGFVVSYMVPGTSSNFKIQAYDANGNAVGSPISVATTTAGSSHPQMTALPNGGFVVEYSDNSPTITSPSVIVQRIFGPLGTANATGTANADNLVGTDGGDTISGAGAADVILAGGGDDKVILNTTNVTSFAAANTMLVDGGSGVNFLQIANTAAGTGTTLDLTNATVLGKLRGFSSIDISGPTTTATNNTLTLDWNAAATLSGAADNAATTGANESKMLVVSGNAGDTLKLVNLASWSVGTVRTAAALNAEFGSSFNFLSGHTYKAFTLAGVTLYVDDVFTGATLVNATPSSTAPAPVSNALTVQELFGPSFADVDSGQTFKGVAITSAGTTAEVASRGKYQFTTDNGTTWTDLGAGLTDSTAVFLAPTALIRFTGIAGNPTVNPTNLVGRLVDTSGQTSSASLVTGNTVNVSTNGGSTAFSGSAVTVSMLNRAPVVSDADGTRNFDPQNAVNVTGSASVDSLFRDVYSDADLDSFQGVLVVASGTTAEQTSLGKFQFQSAAGVWTDIPVTSDTAAVYLAKATITRFVASATNPQGVRPDLTVRLVDQSAGTAFTVGTAFDVSTAKGGSTAVSANTMTIENAAPVLSEALTDQTAITKKDFSYSVLGKFTDPDAGATLTYTATLADGTALPTWLKFNAATATFTALGTDTSALTDTPLNIKVSASDGFVSTATTFKLQLLSSTPVLPTGMGGAGALAVADAGDVNGDGFADVIVSAPVSGVTTSGQEGVAYVVFGSANDLNGTNLKDLISAGNLTSSTPAGFAIDYSVAGAQGFRSVSNAGDVNGDGLSDLVVAGASGSTYLIFGKTSGSLVQVSALGSTGIKIDVPNNGLYNSVSNAGDVNGDGVSDLLITGKRAVTGGTSDALNTYVVFGNPTATSYNLANVASGSGGYLVKLTEASVSNDQLFGVSNAGDVNGDGLSDLIVGSANKNISYVVFGKSAGPAAGISLTGASSLAASDGFAIVGAASEFAGVKVSNAGDVNGDGLADLLVGAVGNASPSLGGTRSYVVFGQSSGTVVNLTNLAGSTPTGGFQIKNNGTADVGGLSVSYAGDINGDGLADVIVSSGFADSTGKTDIGKAYVVYGKADTTAVDLAAVSAGNGGFAISGSTAGAMLGAMSGVHNAVSTAGDVNGDGYDDLIIGSPFSSTSVTSWGSGKAYVIYGGPQFITGSVAAGTGTSAGELVIGTAGNDTLVGNGGIDRFSAGKGNDTIVLQASDATNLANNTVGGDKAYVDGGNGIDTVQLKGGMGLDLTAISNVSAGAADGSSRINSIERIDMATDTGANTLTLSLKDVMDMSGNNVFNSSNTTAGTGSIGATVAKHQLMVSGDSADTVNVGLSNWTDANVSVTFEGRTYEVFNANGGAAAQLLIDQTIINANHLS